MGGSKNNCYNSPKSFASLSSSIESQKQSTLKLDVSKVRNDFPIFSRKVYGKPLVYLDNAATTQKPIQVIDAISDFYSNTNSNIHRGIHTLSEESTQKYESARRTVKEFIGAKHAREIVFTSGATGSLNAIAQSFGEQFIKEGDEVIITGMEHHANIVPWQMVTDRKKAKLRALPISEIGELCLDQLPGMINEKTKIISLTHVSNSLGTINPVKEIIELAHSHNIPVILDGCQSIQHEKIDVQDLDCDFFVFSGHKLYAPTGIGVLYGKEKWLNAMPPYQGGGDMIKHVTFEKTIYNTLPFKFEAGTMNYVGAVALEAAINYVKSIGLDNIARYEQELLDYTTGKLSNIEGLRLIGTSKNKISVVSFVLENIHQYDVGMVLDKMGIAVRTGTHCTEPVMTHFGIDGTVRPSLAFYNTVKEIDLLVEALEKVKMMFG